MIFFMAALGMFLNLSFKLILKQAAAWFLIPTYFGAFSMWYIRSAGQPLPLVDHVPLHSHL